MKFICSVFIFIAVWTVDPVWAASPNDSEPSTADAHYLLEQADAAIGAGRLVQADTMLTKLEFGTVSNGDSMLAFTRAKYHVANGNVDAAAESMAQVDPANVDRCQHESVSGWMTTEQKRWNKAIVHLSSAVEACGDVPILWNLLGLALSGKGEFAAAIEAFDSALASRPDHSALLNNRALARMGNAEPHAALADLTRAISHDPTNVAVRSNIDYLSGLLGQPLSRQPADTDSIWALRMARAGEGAKDGARKADANAYFAKAAMLMDRFDPQIWQGGEWAGRASDQ